ncbi:ras GTPase-activating protein-binding protein 1-like isoform X1 [Papaver somniferum]|uniref:ras GTPase-activating protein-binding protein 1-like isoform X1 n=2 Tax=Papaver somniferum TaxID=3469 RepID=UPI000E6F562E|nr:ras GTPase-activating protein-binding protein 1-like isoform X1 [Papaver somniferum]XP_026424890.1 ras GTPase-activating protein-binding protein 1-like isoform X1 [Papaver somniferum]XP_026424891.1 ras GTPase-activating protein-binding protein 1-like isoform X1 [Papaver somniferum]XP_026424893.1 ras GTPase-activating protein-binding protein 1-like isoform X1 [Papaver somniferum]XP_026424894.1 ras GTPase-activating protein-binding protein 1-like isoform X1 [Papaver somniferum]
MLFTSCFCYSIAVIHNWLTYVAFDQAINQKILSNSTDHKAEIKIADAQYSHVDGVIVLVTGCLTGKDNVGRKFTQSFFLAPQEKGYYIRNDVFRYLDEDQVLKPETVLVNRTSESITAAPVPQELVSSHVPEPVVPDTTAPTAEELNNCVEVHEHPNNKVKVAKENAGPAPVNVPTTTIKVKSATVGKKAPAPAAPTPAHGVSAPNSNNASANNNVVEEVKFYPKYREGSVNGC